MCPMSSMFMHLTAAEGIAPLGTNKVINLFYIYVFFLLDHLELVVKSYNFFFVNVN